MGRKAERITVVRYALLFVGLSVGLSGCASCKSAWSKIWPFGHKPPVVALEAPQPPVVATPQPTPVQVPTPQVTEPVRPEKAPTPEEALKPVYFDFDSSVLRDDARRTLDQDVEWLKANPTVRVQVEGHCDERGTEEYNLHLGERRANAVKQYLVKSGIDQARLFTISYGKDRPVDPGHNEAAWAKNRRAQFSRY